MSFSSRIIQFAYGNYEEYVDSKSGYKMHKARCKFCNLFTAEKTGTTSNFVRHLRRKHPSKHKEYCNSKVLPDPTQQTLAAFSPQHREIAGGFGTMKLFDAKQPRPRAITDAIIKNLIIGCSLPLSIVENPHFREFMHLLEPRYPIVARSTVVSTLLPNLELKIKEIIKEKLYKVNDLSMTVDIWSDRRMRSFLGVTAHIIEEGEAELKLESFTISCRHFQGHHTGYNIANSFDELLDEYGIRNKVNFVITDNAANMKSAFKVHFPKLHDVIDEEGDDQEDDEAWLDLDESDKEDVDGTIFNNCSQRLNCFAHTLQLTVGDGLKETGRQLSQAIAKASKLSSVLHTSTVLKDRFAQAFSEKASIPTANATRWNSSLRQFQAILSYDHKKLTEVCSPEWSNLVFTQREWNQLEELVDVLGPFMVATDLTQGQKPVTISLVAPTVLSLYWQLEKMEERGRNLNCKGMVEALKLSLKKRFHGIFSNVAMMDKSPGVDSEPFGEKIYLVAAMLDPHFALHWVDLFVNPKPKATTPKKQLKADVKDHLKDLLQSELEAVKPWSKERSDPTGNEDEDDGHSESPPRKKPSLFPGLGRSRKQSGESASSSVSSQKARYFEMIDNASDYPFEQGPLPFWRQWKSTFPTMFQLAMKIFSVVATSAPVERVFSQGGIILRPHRACMNAKTLSRLVFIKCNERYMDL